MKNLIFALLLLTGCTAAEGQVAANDASKIAADFAVCVKQHASDPSATPEGVATTCGVAVVPDVLELIFDEIAAARKGAAVDAGAE